MKKNKKKVEVFHSPITSEESLAFLRSLGARKVDDFDNVISEAIDDFEKAFRWLGKPCKALNNKTPLSLLNDDVGRKQVKEVLGQIKYGLFS